MQDLELGTGGGFGKYAGLSVEQIRGRFEQCVADPSMRSISAILRITREQLEARGYLGVYPSLARAALAIALALLGLRFVLPEALASTALQAAAVAGSCAVLLGLGAWKVRLDRRANLAQEAAIRRAAIESILAILQHPVSLKPLIREHRDLVRELIRKDKAHGLAVLLEATP